MESAEGGDISCLAELIQTSVLKFSKKILAHLTSLERIDDIPLLILDITYMCELPRRICQNYRREFWHVL